MKKFFSFLCALTIVLSASAAPMNLRPIGKKQLTKDAIVNHVRKAAPKAPATTAATAAKTEAPKSTATAEAPKKFKKKGID